jgi:hypothetical protein
MKMKTVHVVAALMMVAVVAASVQAAFIVEAHSTGLANATNFTGVGKASVASGAAGLIGTNSIWSGTGSAGSTRDFLFSYTPGTDVDNASSSLPGGGDGLYNVYVSWPATTNVPNGATITVTSEGAPIVNSYIQNTGGTGDPGANDAWLLIAENISLLQGTEYTVNMNADVWSWTSMRAHGVMWEAVPEPMTLMLLGVGGLFLRRRR